MKLKIGEQNVVIVYDSEKSLFQVDVIQGDGGIIRSELRLKETLNLLEVLLESLTRLQKPTSSSKDDRLEDVLPAYRTTILGKLKALASIADEKKKNITFIPAPTSQAMAEVFIGIPQEEINLFKREELTNACGEFMEAMGFELETKEEPVFGSFFQKLWFKLNKPATKAEIEEVYNKGKLALEATYLNKPTADATETIANAATKLIEALKNIDQGVLRLGAILVVKVKKDNETIILAETVSPELASTLDDNPKLLRNPNAIYELMLGDKSPDTKIEEGGGVAS